MQPQQLNGTLRVVNTLLADRGWAVWCGAQPTKGNPATDSPDLIATHNQEGTLLIYINRNTRSCITPSGAPVRVVYALGYEDFLHLIETGRAAQVASATLF